jgi:uncharacterized protein YciI
MKQPLIFVFLLMLINQPITAQTPEHIFVFLNKKADKAELPEEEVKKIMDGHMANINRLAKEGKLIAAGPFDGGGGIFIFKSNSIEQVHEWLKTDPGVQANRWNVEVLPYYPRLGSVCAVGESYKMVTYQFIRYTPNITKYNINQLPLIFNKHHDYLNTLRGSEKVITEAIFGDSDGGILVIDGELTQEVIEKDPAVMEGLLDVDVKKLWIAKGAFCEK